MSEVTEKHKKAIEMLTNCSSFFLFGNNPADNKKMTACCFLTPEDSIYFKEIFTVLIMTVSEWHKDKTIRQFFRKEFLKQ